MIFVCVLFLCSHCACLCHRPEFATLVFLTAVKTVFRLFLQKCVQMKVGHSAVSRKSRDGSSGDCGQLHIGSVGTKAQHLCTSSFLNATVCYDELYIIPEALKT